ncbi:MAG: DUF1501 domain-containing protein [Candidatus Hydrogenedentota bacterium]
MNPITRRDFMKHATVYSALGAVAPHFLTRTVEAATQSIAGFDSNRVLVVVQLGGGNDGLNTLVPHTDDAYHRARPSLGLKKTDILPITDDLGFNKSLVGLKNLYDNGDLAIIQGVGYPNPDRSHFRSMEIWHTASDSDQYDSTGWIGRYFDHECDGAARPQVGVAIGKERPQAFDGTEGFGVSFENPAQYGWNEGSSGDTTQNFTDINAPESKPKESNLDFLRHVTSNAILSSREVNEAAQRAKRDMAPRRGRPINATLSNIASLIKHDLATRIYYVSASGFDTHANQLGAHTNLLSQVSQGLSEFQAQLKKDGTASQVTTMIFSEFGRRVSENKSGGTDHGTAAPMFLMGENVTPGLHGRAPSLTDLDQGDLKFTTDFRNVYATLLKDWLHTDPKKILGQKFDTLPLIG